MSPPDAYTVKLPVFEGPFDLLFHLIKKEELDIWSVSIAAITEQYLVLPAVDEGVKLRYCQRVSSHGSDAAGV